MKPWQVYVDTAAIGRTDIERETRALWRDMNKKAYLMNG